MSRILGRGGRIEAPPDRSLDPRQANRAGGFLRAEGDRGRARATALPVARAGLGDFGPLLFYSMGDATSAAGVVTVPNRTSLSAPLTSYGTAPTLAPFVPGDERHGGMTALELADGADTGLLSPDLSEILAGGLSGEFEIVLLVCLTSAPAAMRRILGNVDQFTGLVGEMGILLEAARTPYVARRVSGSDAVRGAELETDRAIILHCVVASTGASTAEIRYYINGVASGTRVSTSTDAQVWAGPRIYLGADSLGAFLAPPIRIRELAVYPRELTHAERLAMYSGAFAVHESIARRPRFEDVLDLSAASFVSWHPERAPVVVAGLVKSIDAFANTAGTGSAQGLSDTGRGFVTLDGSTDYFDDTGPAFSHIAPDSLTLIVAFLSSSSGTRRTQLAFGASHYIETTVAGEIRAFLFGVSLTAPVLGDVAGKIAIAVVRAPNTLTMQLDAAAFSPGASTFASSSITAAFLPTAASGTLRAGASGTATRKAAGTVIAALAFAGTLSDAEVESVMRFIHQEYNN